jgi:hypothetical protein
MIRFRPIHLNAAPADITDLFAVGQLIDDAMRPGNFFVAPELRLAWVAARSETIPWEIFRGRLLDARQTRLQKTFLSWHVIEENEAHPATEPTISVKLDVHEKQIHVTRGLLAHAWEGYDSGGGVIESRETVKWTRELVGTIRLEEFAELENVREELTCLIWQAIVGTSRLPLTSVETPLPAFSFGQLHYVYRANAGECPIGSWEQLLPLAFEPEAAAHVPIKIVEFVLRHVGPDDLPRFVDRLATGHPHGWALGEIGVLWRRMFNDVSLSPCTRFMENALTVIELLGQREAIGAGEQINFLGRLLRQLGRHLTAYDLVTFHHRGANYPDALLLDALLKRYLKAIERFPDRFLGREPKTRIRRRALRQACLMRRHYEGHLVPDAPTSPGENARVMPASHPRVPEEQLTLTIRRHRQLFADDPLSSLLSSLARFVLTQCVADLVHLDERIELGLGLFIDRPLGYPKAPAEPDLTPMLAHEAFSPSIARRRWHAILQLCDELGLAVDRTAIEPLFEQEPGPTGLPHARIADCPRPVAALSDVRKVADDFVIVRTKAAGLVLGMLAKFKLVQTLRQRYRMRFLDEIADLRLCVQGSDEANQPALLLYDEQLRKRVEIRVDASQGYVTRGGVELPRAGLCVVAVWEDTDDPAVLRRREIDPP